MTEHAVGYKKPPLHSRFGPNNNANPLGRGARKTLKPGEIVSKVLNTLETITEKGKNKRVSRIHRLVRRYGNAALKGDATSAALLLELRQHFETRGDINPRVLIVTRVIVSPPPRDKAIDR